MAKRPPIPHFNDFPTLMENLILPYLLAYPDFERLDGHLSKGNRTIFATFNHQGLKWKIAMDTKSDRLLKAWKLYQAGNEPFVQGSTGHRLCLRLNDGSAGKANGLYVYQVG